MRVLTLSSKGKRVTGLWSKIDERRVSTFRFDCTLKVGHREEKGRVPSYKRIVGK